MVLSLQCIISQGCNLAISGDGSMRDIQAISQREKYEKGQIWRRKYEKGRAEQIKYENRQSERANYENRPAQRGNYENRPNSCGI